MRMDANIPDSGPLLEAVLEGFVQASMLILQSGAVPLFPSQAGVRFQAEHGTEHWQLPHETLKLGYGDCEDLAMWEAAGYRVSGMDPGASVLLVQTGTNALHAIVQLSDGSHSDPSLRLMHPTQAQKQGLTGQLHLAADAGQGGGTTLLGDGDGMFIGDDAALANASGVLVRDHRANPMSAQDLAARAQAQIAARAGGHEWDQAVANNPGLAAYAVNTGHGPTRGNTDFAKTGVSKRVDISTPDKAFGAGLVYIDDGYTPGHFARPTAGGMDPMQYAQGQYGGAVDPNDPLDMQYGYPGYGYPNYYDPGSAYGAYGGYPGQGGYPGGYSPFYPQGQSPFDYQGGSGAYGWQGGDSLMTYQDLYPQDFQQMFPLLSLPNPTDAEDSLLMGDE